MIYIYMNIPIYSISIYIQIYIYRYRYMIVPMFFSPYLVLKKAIRKSHGLRRRLSPSSGSPSCAPEGCHPRGTCQWNHGDITGCVQMILHIYICILYVQFGIQTYIYNYIQIELYTYISIYIYITYMYRLIICK